jgi:hypothetical protein
LTNSSSENEDEYPKKFDGMGIDKLVVIECIVALV